MKLNLIAASALLAFAGASQATTYDMGTLAPADSFAGQSGVFGAGAAINDTWTFELTGAADASGLISRTFAKGVGGITGFAATIMGGSLATPASFWLNTTASSQTLEAAGMLGAGSYAINVMGTSTKANTRYSVLVDVTPAVPEPGTYALMLAGLAAVGFIASRRKV
jgi:PEP-CTERM motif